MIIHDNSLNSRSNLFGNDYRDRKGALVFFSVILSRSCQPWGQHRWLAGLCNWRRKCAYGFLGPSWHPRGEHMARYTACFFSAAVVLLETIIIIYIYRWCLPFVHERNQPFASGIACDVLVILGTQPVQSSNPCRWAEWKDVRGHPSNPRWQ